MYQYSQMMGQPGFMSQQLAQQQAMMLAAQQQQQGRHFPNNFMSAQQQAAIYSMQQQQLQQYQQLQNMGRKRKLDSMALCIKDGKVYSKPFVSLPSFLFNNNKTEKTKVQIPKAPQLQSVYQSSVNHQLPSMNPYNPVQSVQPHMFDGQNPYQPLNTQNTLSSIEQQLYQRLGQKPPNNVKNDESNSVENDDYRSDEDYDEVIGGQEIMDDDEGSRDESYRSEDDDIQSCDDIDTPDNQETIDNVEVSRDNGSNETVGNTNECSESNQDNLPEEVSGQFTEEPQACLNEPSESVNADSVTEEEANDTVAVEAEVNADSTLIRAEVNTDADMDKCVQRTEVVEETIDDQYTGNDLFYDINA